jgi:hypothetical protein
MFHLFQKAPFDPAQVQPGDIIGFSGEGWVSIFINCVTYGIPLWSISHVGIVGEHDGKLLVFESTTTNDVPCEVTGKCIAGSQAHNLQHHIDHYKGRLWHYPLSRSLYHHELKRLKTFLHKTVGLSYDNIGAFRAGGVGFSWLESQLLEADLHSLFCSEWCAAAHAEIGVFATDNVARWSPNLLTRTERRMGILKKPRRIK